MMWIRKKSKDNKEKYHIDYHGNPSQDTHYLTTLCQCEVKGLYWHWDITEDPKESECCTKCLSRIRHSTGTEFQEDHVR